MSSNNFLEGKAIVSLRKCQKYDSDKIAEFVQDCINDLGGFKSYINNAKNILLKPNLLSATPPEKAVTTHPGFIEGVIKALKENCPSDTKIIIADSPGVSTPHTKKNLKNLYEKCEIAYLGKIENVILSYDEDFEFVSFKEGSVLKQLQVIKPVLQSDVIINLPKFKTHSLTKITGAVKNMYGIIYGRTKTILHTKFMDIEKFCNATLDIYLYTKPVLNVMDAIIGMEGEGPGSSGKPKNVGLIIASNNAVALDNIMSLIMGGKRSWSLNVPVLTCAKNRKIFGSNLQDIKIIDETGNFLSFNDTGFEKYVIKDFILPKDSIVNTISKNKFLNNYIFPFIRNNLSLSPYQNLEKCNMCQICVGVCPQDAIEVNKNNKNLLSFNYKKCIRCYCCSEMCPQGAIDLRYSLIGNLIFKRKNIK